MSKKITILMPCFLGEYQGGAKDRAIKLNRAIQSFIRQDYNNKNLIIISDGCHETVSFVSKNYPEFDNIKVHFIEKQPLFSGNVRDFGLKIADGDFVTYLDADDFYNFNNHLTIIVNGFNDNPECEWLIFDDFVKYFALEHLPLAQREAKLEQGSIGTSNIAHKNLPEISWENCHGYNHDYTFIMKLAVKYKNYKKIDGCSYVVCHIPNTCDS